MLIWYTINKKKKSIIHKISTYYILISKHLYSQLAYYVIIRYVVMEKIRVVRTVEKRAISRQLIINCVPIPFNIAGNLIKREKRDEDSYLSPIPDWGNTTYRQRDALRSRCRKFKMRRLFFFRCIYYIIYKKKKTWKNVFFQNIKFAYRSWSEILSRTTNMTYIRTYIYFHR